LHYLNSRPAEEILIIPSRRLPKPKYLQGMANKPVLLCLSLTHLYIVKSGLSPFIYYKLTLSQVDTPYAEACTSCVRF